VSRADVLLWVALPYVCLSIFVVGHVWRYRRDQFRWTARSTQLLERRLLLVGSLLFHFGILAAIGGHVLGILVPRSWTGAVGIDDHAYHWLAVVAGGAAGLAVLGGFVILVYRRVLIDRVRATTLASDRILYPLLALTIVTGVLATFWGSAVDDYAYRETVSPYFRGIFSFRPNWTLMQHAPWLFKLHVVSAFVLYAAWPFSRLVHVWSVPLTYLGRAQIVYRSREAHAAIDRQAAARR
jgi:nitrate reductase gamma subunit